MASRRTIDALVSGVGLVGLGGAAVAAWQSGLWGTVLGVVLASIWLLTRNAGQTTRPCSFVAHPGGNGVADSLPLRLLLDQVPIPLLGVEAGATRALNRAARKLFATDDRILPVPTALGESDSRHMLHQGRRFRIDRVEVDGGVVAALIDVDAEERTGEARATAEMIQVFGHEMLNGLAPIVSLAESGLAAIDSPAKSAKLLPEILGTLARRAESLLRFTEAYRTMARLPDPVRAPVSLRALADDLVHLFASHWADAVALDVDIDHDPAASIDRDQITQAVWALLQNGAEAALSVGENARVSFAIRREADQLLLDVTDTGHGVAVEEAARIFRPFHTNKPNGTGVGLSLARQIALAHGGELVLTATRPAKFRLSIPAELGNSLSRHKEDRSVSS